MQQIRVWEVTDENKLHEIGRSQISLEERLEGWLASDISVLDPNLLVIGRQVRTDFAKAIDLLCLDNNGDTVVVELKRGQTPREVVAQVLDYSSWVCDLPDDRIREIASKHFSNPDSFEEAFQNRFEKKLPNELNNRHRSLIIAESMDDSTERIVRYLSRLQVPINVATIQHFKDNSGRSMLAQVYLLDPQEVEPSYGSTPKRRSPGTVKGLQKLADEKGVGELYSRIREGVRGIMTAQPYNDRVWYRLARSDGSVRTALIVDTFPNQTTGGLGFTFHATRFEDLLGVSAPQLKSWLPNNTFDEDVKRWAGSSEGEKAGAQGLSGVFNTEEEVDKFVCGLKETVLRTTAGSLRSS